MRNITTLIILLSSLYLVSCDRGVTIPEDRTSGDTTKMNFDETADGDVMVTVPYREEGNSAADSPHTITADDENLSSTPESSPPTVDTGGLVGGIRGLIGKFGQELRKGLAEISGKARKKKHEAERKAQELIGLLSEMERLKSEISDRVKELDDMSKRALGDSYYGEEETKTLINAHGIAHNQSLEGIVNLLPELATPPSESQSPQTPMESTEEQESVLRVKTLIRSAHSQIKDLFSGDELTVRQSALEAADLFADAALQAYREGELLDGYEYTEMSRKIVDMVLSSTPIVGDLYAISGAILHRNPVTGEEISDDEAIIQGIGAIYSLASGGTLGQIYRVSQILKVVIKTQVKKEMRGAAKEQIRNKIKERQENVDAARSAAEEARKAVASKEPSARQFEASISRLPPGERVAKIKVTLTARALQYGWTKDKKLSRINNRDVYQDHEGNLWAFDTQHGRYEKCSAKGKHQGEFDIDRQPIPNSIDSSQKHDLIIE